MEMELGIGGGRGGGGYGVGGRGSEDEGGKEGLSTLSWALGVLAGAVRVLIYWRSVWRDSRDLNRDCADSYTGTTVFQT